MPPWLSLGLFWIWEHAIIRFIKSSPENIYLKTYSASFSPSTECLIPDLHPELLPGGVEGQELQHWWLDTYRSRWQASVHSWQSLTEEHIWATVPESLEKYSRCGNVILGWERDSSHFNRSSHCAAILREPKAGGSLQKSSSRASDGTFRALQFPTAEKAAKGLHGHRTS